MKLLLNNNKKKKVKEKLHPSVKRRRCLQLDASVDRNESTDCLQPRHQCISFDEP
jgi:hypothetical protein